MGRGSPSGTLTAEAGTGGTAIDLLLDRVESPIGTLLLVSDGASLCALGYADGEDRPSHPGGGDGAGRARRPGYADGEDRLARLLRARYGEARLREAADPQGFGSRLRAYLAGDLGALAAIPVETGGTPFQRRVWEALRTIPAGTTVTYGALAAQLGRPEASRAVGQANGRNPVPIVVPCHRVVGARAGAGLALTGYGGGLARKRWLLEHEGALATLEGEGG